MGNLFNIVLEMSLAGSYVIVGILITRFLLKGFPKWISYLLWSVAGFRLIFPIALKSPISFLPKSTKLGSLLINESISLFTSEKRIFAGTYEPISSKIAEKTTTNTFSYLINQKETFVTIWIIGVIALTFYYVYSSNKIRKMLKSARKISEHLYEADNISSPFVFGWLKARIYFPEGLNENERDYILLHEEIHLKRKDALVKVVAFLILCIHWFNPLVWIAFLVMNSDMELSCDEKVLKEKGIQIKKNYAKSLLTLATIKSSYQGSQLAFGNITVKTRIKNALRYKNPKFFVSMGGVALVMILILGFGTNPMEGNLFKEAAVSLDNIESEQRSTKYELVYNEEHLHAYGQNFKGKLNSLSDQVLPEENIFDFVFLRNSEEVIAEIVFPSSGKDALYFVVDLLEGEVIDKRVYETEFDLSSITNNELIDMATSIKQMTIPMVSWEE